ncbi:MAG: hypothetical protein V3S64_01995 [bacterium]
MSNQNNEKKTPGEENQPCFDMSKMKEMMAGMGCGEGMREMMAACCGKPGASEDDASEEGTPEKNG